MITPQNYRFSLSTLALGVALLLSSCSSSDSTVTQNSDSPVFSPPVSISGQTTKGPVAGAEIRINHLNDDGSRGVQLAGPFYTDSEGRWSGELASGGRGPFEVVSRWGSYTDEATLATIAFEAGDEMSGILDLSQTTRSTVTPMSHAILMAARNLVAYNGMTVDNAIEQVRSDIANALGIDVATLETIDPTQIPADVTAEQRRYAVLLGGVSSLLNNNANLTAFSGARKLDLVIGLMRDLSDGLLDGLDVSGVRVQVPTGGSLAVADLPALDVDGIEPLLIAANDYAQNTTGLESVVFAINTSIEMGRMGVSLLHNNLRLSINGAGYFILDAQGTWVYSRYDAFGIDANGFMVNARGQVLQGDIADQNGNLINATGDLNLASADFDVSDVVISNTGVIQAQLSGGGWRTLGQVQLAKFTAPQRLKKLAENSWAESFESGQPVIAQPGTSQLGLIQVGTLDSTALDYIDSFLSMGQATSS